MQEPPLIPDSLVRWLQKEAGLTECTIIPLPADASLRRYFRVRHQGQSWIVMDASYCRESCDPFLFVAERLRAAGLPVPDILTKNCASGFLLMTDLGDDHLLKVLLRSPERVSTLYEKALDILHQLQRCDTAGLPPFSTAIMQAELTLFAEWFLQKQCGLALSAAKYRDLQMFFDFLAAEIAAQPVVFMHRDFHSANLMVLPENGLGILDFQDAFLGPFTYDPVSLLRDCYISWPPEKVTQWAHCWYQQCDWKTGITPAQFMRWFDLTGIQRHLKALMTFARKWHQQQDGRYLQHIPRTLAQVRAVSAHYPECRILLQLLASPEIATCGA